MQTVEAEVVNLMSTNKTFRLTGELKTIDRTNGYHAIATFDKNAKDRTGYFASYIKSKKMDKDGFVAARTDLTNIKIYKT